jgi:hypothetical protein
MERTAVFRAAVRSETMGHRWQVAESASAGSQVLAGQLPELATIGLPRPAALRQKWSVASTVLGRAGLRGRYNRYARDRATRRAGWRRIRYA